MTFEEKNKLVITVGKNIRILRKKSKKSVRRICEDLYVSTQSIYCWEEGRRFPPLWTLLDIMDYFGVDYTWMTSEHEEKAE